MWRLHQKERNNYTLYELAQTFSDTGDADEGVPYMIKWLFKDFVQQYEYRFPIGEQWAATQIQVGVVYNLSYFTLYNFYNREICHKKPQVFRQMLLRTLVNMQFDFDFNNVLAKVIDATADLSRREQTLYTRDLDSSKRATKANTFVGSTSEDEDNEQVITHDTTDTSRSTANETSSSSSSTHAEAEVNDTETRNLASTGTHTAQKTDVNDTDETNSGTNSSTTTTRVVASDYPQSTVDTTIPLDWDYASQANDSRVTGSGTSSNTRALDSTDTSSLQESNSGSDTGTVTKVNTSEQDGSVTNQGTAQNTATATIERDGTDTTTQDNTRNIAINNTENETTQETKADDIEDNTDKQISYKEMSGISLNSLQLQLFEKYDSFYKRLLDNVNKCFISLYINEDRDGWLDPSLNILSAWYDH